MASKAALRLTNFGVETLFESLKLSTTTALGLTRRVLVSSVSSARTLHLMALKNDKNVDHEPFFKVLDDYTNLGIAMVHNAFSVAELLTLTSFYLASSSIRFTISTVEEAVLIFDGLFGETDTSKALAAFFHLFIEEWKGQEDELGLGRRFGKISALGQITKAVIAYSCLQYVTRKRWRSLIKLEVVFEGRAPRFGSYDPAAEFVNIFSTVVDPKVSKNKTAPKTNPTLPTFVPVRVPRQPRERRRSLQATCSSLALSSLETAPLMNHSTSLPSSPTHRRRHRSGIPGDGHVANMFYMMDPPVTDEIPSSPATLKDSQSSPTLFGEIPPRSKEYDVASKVQLGSRFVKFAVGAYGTNFLKIMGIGNSREWTIDTDDEYHNHQTLAFHTDISVEDIISSSFHTPTLTLSPGITDPIHYVVVDVATSSVIVSLRGTLAFSDVVTDLTAQYSRYQGRDGEDGFVHKGMYMSAQNIAASPIREAVAGALRKYPTFSLVLTGHSLGAGCSAILAMLWSRRIKDENGNESFVTDVSSGLPQRPISCYVYGCPALMSANLSRNDVFPTLSFGLIRDFKNVTVNLLAEKGMAEKLMGKVLGIFKTCGEGEQNSDIDDELWFWALLKTLRADMNSEKLYPPGTVFWINANTVSPGSQPARQKSDKGKKLTTPISLHLVDDVEVAFSELAFSSRMFTDHSPHHYEGSLKLIVDMM